MQTGARSQAAVKMLVSERRAVAALGFVLALRMFGLFALLPVLALYAGGLPGGTPLLAGLAVGAFGITQALLQIPAGLLSDRIGRKAVIVLGLVLFALGSIIAAESQTIAGVLAGRILQGAGAISAAATALVADLTRTTVRTRAMAVVGISIGATFMLSLALGPVLADRFGVGGLFYLGAVFAVVAMLVVIVAPGNWRRPQHEATFDFGGGLADRRLVPLHAGIFLLHVMLTATFVAVPFLLRDGIGISPAVHSRVYLAAMLLSLMGTLPLIIAVERLSRPLLVFAMAVVLLAAGQFSLVASTSSLAVTVAMAVFFAGFNFVEARLPAQVSQLAQARSRGAALGVFATAQFLGAFTGGLLGGALIGTGGPDKVFAVCGLLGLGWVATLAAARQRLAAEQ